MDVRWLTDLLPETLKNHQPCICARIFCFNYQSAWLGKITSKNRLDDIAQRLLDDVKSGVQRSGKDRPILFIGHSFGGLVIEQAIVKASLIGSGYEALVRQLGGIVLLGTPHQGSKMQAWGSIVAKLASLGDFGETALMSDVDEKSMTTYDLVFNFMQVMIHTDMARAKAVVCFYENLPTDYSRRTGISSSWISSQTSSMVGNLIYNVYKADDSRWSRRHQQ